MENDFSGAKAGERPALKVAVELDNKIANSRMIFNELENIHKEMLAREKKWAAESLSKDKGSTGISTK